MNESDRDIERRLQEVICERFDLPRKDVTACKEPMHPVTVRKWVAAGKIPHVSIGGRVKFDPGALAEWLDKRTLN
jgi:excisionase family DNA binding protein